MKKEEAMEILKDFHDESATFSVRTALETLHPELKEGEDERTRKAILTGLIDCRDAPDLGWSNFGGINIDECIAWIKKEGKGKLTNKPKFKVGDWIVQNNIGIYKIVEVCESWYEVIDNQNNHYSIGFDKEYMCHLWTIEDAKDGDILCSNQIIVLFKQWEDNTDYSFVIAHAGIDVSSKLQITNEHWLISNESKPANKEQRDLLFQKMKEDGYEWNAERKELKKIEDEEYNGEDYGIDSLWHAKNILEETLGKVDGYRTDDGILSHQCAITAVKKLYEQKPAEWSEEDEENISQAIYVCHQHGYTGVENWLKSLKERCAWKPSEEQMDALNSARWNAPFNIEILDSLYNDLKKLTE